MIWGIDFSAFETDMTSKIMKKCFENGLILERVGRNNNTLKLMPPLITDEETLLKGLNILKRSIVEVIG